MVSFSSCQYYLILLCRTPRSFLRGILQKKMYVRNWKTANFCFSGESAVSGKAKGVPDIWNAFVQLQYTRFPEIVKSFFLSFLEKSGRFLFIFYSFYIQNSFTLLSSCIHFLSLYYKQFRNDFSERQFPSILILFE